MFTPKAVNLVGAPAADGGHPVENYVVEKMDEASGRWVPVGETEGPQTSVHVDGLTPGHKYKFRVCAQNRQGKSEPLTTRRPKQSNLKSHSTNLVRLAHRRLPTMTAISSN